MLLLLFGVASVILAADVSETGLPVFSEAIEPCNSQANSFVTNGNFIADQLRI